MAWNATAKTSKHLRFLVACSIAYIASVPALGSPRIDLLWRPAPREFPFSIVFDPKAQAVLAYSDGSLRRASLSQGLPAKFGATKLDFQSKGGGYIERGMACDGQGNLFLTDGNALHKLDPRGSLTQITGGFQDAIDLKVDLAGNLYVAEAQECAVYKLTPDLTRTRLVARSHKFRMYEMVSGIALDPAAKSLYLAERYSGQILRYPLGSDGQAGSVEVMATNIVSLRSIAVDHRGNIFANIDFPVIIRIDAQKRQTRILIPNNSDFCMGRMSLGQTAGERDNLYIPTKQGVVRISNAHQL